MDWDKIYKEGPTNDDLAKAGFILDSSLIKILNHYVYAYYEDSSEGTIPFYIGKGTGSRCVDHLRRSDSHECTDKIRELYAEKRWPVIRILRYGLESDKAALEVEAAAIDAVGIQNLTNKQKGYHSSVCGKQDLKAFIKKINLLRLELCDLPDDSLIIRLNDKTFYEEISEAELYDFTRSSWRIRNPLKDGKSRIRYVLAVHGGIIRQIYVPVGWFPAGSTLRYSRKEGDLTAPDTTSIRPRWEFVGYISNDETKELVGRKIEWGDFKGCQNPCIYTNFLKTKSLADAPEDDEKMTGEERVELNGSAS